MNPPFTPLRDGFGSYFAEIEPACFTRVTPTAQQEPYWVCSSPSCAELLQLPAKWNDNAEWAQALSGNSLLPGSSPLASVYSGHQFGQWAGQLGDGRALLLGDSNSMLGKQEWQLKGAGKTPYSRGGDGRAVLRSSIREFLCSEAMHALGVPTTRALAIVGSDLPVFRENVESAAVVTRVAPSFLRFGHFEHWYYQTTPGHLKMLADYLIAQHFQELAELKGESRYQALLSTICRRTASLVAHWQAIGFCHGVLNTDNMSVLGLTIDYGPFGFLDGFNANHICNHSDHQGRYAYSAQPGIGEWNCFALGQTFVDLCGGVEPVKQALLAYREEFLLQDQGWKQRKLGLRESQQGDQKIWEELLVQMHESRADFTSTFRRLSGLNTAVTEHSDQSLRDLFVDRERFDAWLHTYRARLTAEHSIDSLRQAEMRLTNPKYVLRNHLAELAIRKASEGARDYGEIARLLAILERPFDEQPEFDSYAQPAPDWASNLEVSCSS